LIIDSSELQPVPLQVERRVPDGLAAEVRNDDKRLSPADGQVNATAELHLRAWKRILKGNRPFGILLVLLVFGLFRLQSGLRDGLLGFIERHSHDVRHPGCFSLFNVSGHHDVVHQDEQNDAHNQGNKQNPGDAAELLRGDHEKNIAILELTYNIDRAVGNQGTL